ncbi:hypothetical protein PT974_02466 [Cladobotryum mycophilum]|uniref:Ubiquitin-like domain-containing protein n=1 Tax=Cladobotryum mycophilum TaxID=491253 RepID=A0ABR0SYN8_9HYPO
MAEVLFAKTFLTSLDSRPIKLSGDHVEDPKNFPSRPPYILPRMPKPMSQPTAASAPGQERSITVTLKSLRNPPLDIKLTSQPLNTSILDIKTAVSGQSRIPVEKLKILHNKRPVQDSKVLKELVGESDTVADFSVMVIGGAAAIQPEETEAPASTTEDRVADLETDGFWADLNGFLMQRLKSEAKAEELSSLFRSSWQASASSS